MKLLILSLLIPVAAAQAQQSVTLRKGESLDVSCPAGTQIDVAQPSRSRSLISCARSGGARGIER